MLMRLPAGKLRSRKPSVVPKLSTNMQRRLMVCGRLTLQSGPEVNSKHPTLMVITLGSFCADRATTVEVLGDGLDDSIN
jgi:hypothetical protein